MNADEKLAQWMQEREAREHAHARSAAGLLAAGSDVWKLFGAGVGVALVLTLCFAPWRSGSSDSGKRATRVSDPNPRFLTEYQEELTRHRELGNKIRLTAAEEREYLLLDARIGVKEGVLTPAEFEQKVGQKY